MVCDTGSILPSITSRVRREEEAGSCPRVERYEGVVILSEN